MYGETAVVLLRICTKGEGIGCGFSCIDISQRTLDG